MKFSFRLFSLIIMSVCLCAGTAPADESSHGRISGSIKSASGNPLHNAIVKIFKVVQKDEALAIAGVRSNSSGFFRAFNLTPGTYYMQVQRNGFRDYSTERFEVSPDRTTSLSITLQNIIDYVSNDDDPRNWELNTVLRSSSDRRMIFRYLPAGLPDSEPGAYSTFHRNGSMSMASSTSSMGSMPYLSRPQTSQNGVVTNFAFSEPLTHNSRMIFSGQFDVGKTTFWRIRNTLNYRPDKHRDYKISLGYGRMNVGYIGDNSHSSQLVQEEEGSRESRIQSIAFGLEGTSTFYNLLSINYGFDYSHLRYGSDTNFVHPSLKIVVSPLEGWQFTTSFTSRRNSDLNSVMLPNGEILNLSEPTLITLVGDDISLSRVRHSEVAVERTFSTGTTLGFAVYRDNTYGPGIPLMVTMITPRGQTSKVVNLNESRSSQQGMRITLNRQMFSNLKGSLSYVYGEAMSVYDVDESLSVQKLNKQFQTYTGQQFHHSLTGKVNLSVPETNTNILATIRWHPGNPVSTIDWFSDPLDIGAKSLNVEIRQAVPFQDVILDTGWWEILLDFRNVLNQGEDVIPASDGILVLNRSPRSLRFGLNLNFH